MSSGAGPGAGLGAGAGSLTVGHQLKGDRSVQQRLGASLASDAVQIEQELRDMNALDVRLWAYAQELVRSRWARLSAGLPGSIVTATSSASSVASGSVSAVALASGAARQSGSTCGSGLLPPQLMKEIGLFRPPGHKGPLDSLEVLKVR